MPFNGSGGFNRVRKWVNDAAGNVKIRADYHDAEDDNLAAGLSSVITKDGQTQPTANIPMNGKRVVNAGDPVNPQDYATRHWVEVLPGWSTSKSISGADADGRLNFTSPTGANGIGWTGAGMSWLAKLGEASKTSNRLVLSDYANGDVFTIDEHGQINAPTWTWNLSYDGTQWRTIGPGLATHLTLQGGNLALSGLDAATTLDPYKPAAIRKYFDVLNQGGAIIVDLFKKDGTAGKYVSLRSYTGTEIRWQMQLGDGTAEGGTRIGSDFVLTSYDNSGLNGINELIIDRETHKATLGGDLTIAGQMNFDSILQSTDTAAILAALNGGTVYLRPNGNASATGQAYVDTAGDLHTTADVWVGGAGTAGGTYAGKGIMEKPGGSTGGTYGTEFINFAWTTALHAYRDNTDIGAITVTCDYRIKQDVQPLTSTWDKVKAMRPVSYRRCDFEIGGVTFSTDSPETEWGFIAHELQDTLLPTAASGAKDAEYTLQSPNLLAVLAALTRALQEAQLRIEALEAA